MNRREFILGSITLGLTGPLSCSSNYPEKECEVLRCKKDILHFAKTYLDTDISKDHTKKLLTSCASNEDVVLDAYRMSGKSTLCRVYAIWKAVFEPHRQISLVSESRLNASLTNNALEDMISRLPDWMLHGTHDLQRRSPRHFTFGNGSKIYTLTDFEAEIGFNVGKVMILDEFAFFKDQNEFIGRTLPVLKHNKGQLIMASTPNRHDDMFAGFASDTSRMTVITAKKV